MEELRILFPKVDIIKLAELVLDCSELEAKILTEEFFDNFHGGVYKNDPDFKSHLPNFCKFLIVVKSMIKTGLLVFEGGYLVPKRESFWELAERHSRLKEIVQFYK